MSSWQQLLQQEAGVLISTPKRAKRVRRKRVRTSPLSGTARRMLVSGFSLYSLAGPDDSPTLAPVPESDYRQAQRDYNEKPVFVAQYQIAETYEHAFFVRAWLTWG